MNLKIIAEISFCCAPLLAVFADFKPELPENFKAKYSAAVANAPMMRGMNLVSCFKYDEKDIADLAAWKANLIRWQISRGYKKVGANRDMADYDKWIDAEIAKIKNISALAKKYGIKIIIEMHTPSGGVDKNNNMLMFYEPEYAAHFVEVWGKIAKELKGDRTIFAYDLLNEPVQNKPSENDYLKIQYDAAKAIRKIDRKKPLIVASKNWNNPSSFNELYPLPMKDILYSVHMYRPHDYTHQGIGGKLTMADIKAGRNVKYPSDKFGKDDIARELKPVTDFEEKYGAKIFLGEFGLVRWAPNGGEYLKDCIEFFEGRKWIWANHAYREHWNGFSAEHADDINVNEVDLNNSRMRALLEGFSKNFGEVLVAPPMKGQATLGD